MSAVPMSYGVEHAPREKPVYSREAIRSVRTPDSSQRRGAEFGDYVSLFCAEGPEAGTGLAPAWDALDSTAADSEPEEEGEPAWCASRRYAGDWSTLALHEDLVDFWHAFRPTRAERAARKAVVDRLESAVGEVWEGATVRVFGSFSTGLYLPESDIDLVCIGTGLEGAPKNVRGRALHALAAAIRRAGWPVHSLEVVDKAKVPIVKLVDGSSGVAVDVCIEERTGIASSGLAKKASGQFPAYRVLVLVLKRFLNDRGLHDTFTGGIGSYLLQLMVISSLQVDAAARRDAPWRSARGVACRSPVA